MGVGIAVLLVWLVGMVITGFVMYVNSKVIEKRHRRHDAEMYMMDGILLIPFWPILPPVIFLWKRGSRWFNATAESIADKIIQGKETPETLLRASETPELRPVLSPYRHPTEKPSE